MIQSTKYTLLNNIAIATWAYFSKHWFSLTNRTLDFIHYYFLKVTKNNDLLYAFVTISVKRCKAQSMMLFRDKLQLNFVSQKLFQCTSEVKL